MFCVVFTPARYVTICIDGTRVAICGVENIECGCGSIELIKGVVSPALNQSGTVEPTAKIGSGGDCHKGAHRRGALQLAVVSPAFYGGICVNGTVVVEARGKGNKLIGIPSARAAAREEFVAGLCVVTEGDTLQVTSGGHYRNFKWSELEHFRGERGRRGSKLPKGYQRVTHLEVVAD